MPACLLPVFLIAAALSGCVAGYGRCLFLSPATHTLTGRLHFQTFSAPDGRDNVPILELDRTEYVYAPAQSHSCLSATELQLVGVAEFPASVGENSRVSVAGTLSQQTDSREHTRFIMNVNTLLPSRPEP